MISPHVDIRPSGRRNLLQLPLWTWCPPQVVESTHNPQHSRQSSPTRLPAKTGVRSQSVMDISIHGPVEPDCVRLGEELGFAVRTDEAAEDFVSRLHLNWAASVINGCRYGALAVGAGCSVEPDTFHCVVQELVVCFAAFGFGPFVDFREVDFPFV